MAKSLFTLFMDDPFKKYRLKAQHNTRKKLAKTKVKQ